MKTIFLHSFGGGLSLLFWLFSSDAQNARSFNLRVM